MKKLLIALAVATPLQAETLSGLWCFDQNPETHSCGGVMHIQQKGDDVKASAIALYEIDGKPTKLVFHFLARAAGEGFCFAPILTPQDINLLSAANRSAFISEADKPVSPEVFEREVGASQLLRRPASSREFCTPFPRPAAFISESEAKEVTLHISDSSN